MTIGNLDGRLQWTLSRPPTPKALPSWHTPQLENERLLTLNVAGHPRNALAV